jgi:hypothetical protein
MNARIRLLLLGFLLAASGGALSAQDGSLGKVIVSYSLERLDRRASNQIAVWIESAGGDCLKTLFATDFMARRKGFLLRPQCCPEWVKASGLAEMTEAQIDAISGASQSPGRISLSWDCTDQKGNGVPPGIYLYKAEGNISFETRVLWTGRITVGKRADSSRATAEWLPEKPTDGAELLTEVSARFQPAGR